MREKWFEHSPSTNLITHGTEGKDSGFVILRHQTLLLPGLNVDFSSERIKGPGSFPVGLATWHMIHMPDHMPLKDSIWSSVFSRALIQVSAFILTIVTKNKAFVMEMNALTELWVCWTQFETLVHIGVRIWQLQLVRFNKKPMDHPGIFLCTSRMSVSNF